ncbi:Core Sm protein Sm G, spliceosomal U1, U2, U4, and U5 snRNPs component [Hanseniaspora osmophila]
MAKVSTPELQKYIGRKIMLNINGNRKVVGILKGYDIYMNVVVQNALEVITSDTNGGEPNTVKMGKETIIRGNSIISLEALENI